jgi:hypothetical protein
MTINVSQSATQSVAFGNTRSNFYTMPTYCGPRKFVFSPALPLSYMTIDVSLSTLTVTTNNVADVGTHLISFDVSLQNYPGVLPISHSFQVIISCLVYNLSYSTAPTNMFIEPSATVQPFSENFVTSQVPNCGHPVTFVLVPGYPSFVGLQGLAASSGSVVVSGAVLGNVGIYPVTLRATVDG